MRKPGDIRVLYLYSGFREAGVLGEIFACVYVWIVRALERSLQPLELLRGEGRPTATLLPLDLQPRLIVKFRDVCQRYKASISQEGCDRVESSKYMPTMIAVILNPIASNGGNKIAERFAGGKHNK